jgi:hypothetical protein
MVQQKCVVLGFTHRTSAFLQKNFVSFLMHCGVVLVLNCHIGLHASLSSQHFQIVCSMECTLTVPFIILGPNCAVVF